MRGDDTEEYTISITRTWSTTPLTPMEASKRVKSGPLIIAVSCSAAATIILQTSTLLGVDAAASAGPMIWVLSGEGQSSDLA